MFFVLFNESAFTERKINFITLSTHFPYCQRLVCNIYPGLFLSSFICSRHFNSNSFCRNYSFLRASQHRHSRRRTARTLAGFSGAALFKRRSLESNVRFVRCPIQRPILNRLNALNFCILTRAGSFSLKILTKSPFHHLSMQQRTLELTRLHVKRHLNTSTKRQDYRKPKRK